MLYPSLAEGAIRERVGRPLGLDIVSAAATIVEISNRRMADAIQLVSLQRGIDPSGYTLVMGGGAGPIQAGRLAEVVGIRHLIVPQAPGVLCALGFIWGNLSHDQLRTYAVTAEAADLKKMSALYKEMERSLAEQLRSEGIQADRAQLKRFIDARYRGQVYEIEVEVPLVEELEPENLKKLLDSFGEAHERLYHYRMDGFPVEFVNCRTTAIGLVAPIDFEELPDAGSDPSPALKGRRKVYAPTAGKFVDGNVYDGGKLRHGNTIEGVAIVDTVGSTVGIWEGQRLLVNKYGDFELYVPPSGA